MNKVLDPEVGVGQPTDTNVNPSGVGDSLLKQSEGRSLDTTDNKSKVPSKLSPEKKKEIILLCLCMVLSQTTRQNVIALLPPFCDDNFPQFAGLASGVLLCSYQIGFIFTAPFVGAFLPKIGRKNAVTTGLMCMVISSYSYAFASYMTSPTAFYAVSYVSRLV